jgi:hypothetical protein
MAAGGPGARVKIPEILMIETVHQPGSLAKVLLVIADAGLTIDHLQAILREQGRTLWEITLEMDEEADRSLYERIDALPIARFVGKSDRVFDPSATPSPSPCPAARPNSPSPRSNGSTAASR